MSAKKPLVEHSPFKAELGAMVIILYQPTLASLAVLWTNVLEMAALSRIAPGSFYISSQGASPTSTPRALVGSNTMVHCVHVHNKKLHISKHLLTPLFHAARGSEAQ
jgi:hypothetical protein